MVRPRGGNTPHSTTRSARHTYPPPPSSSRSGPGGPRRTAKRVRPRPDASRCGADAPARSPSAGGRSVRARLLRASALAPPRAAGAASGARRCAAELPHSARLLRHVARAPKGVGSLERHYACQGSPPPGAARRRVAKGARTAQQRAPLAQERARNAAPGQSRASAWSGLRVERRLRPSRAPAQPPALRRSRPRPGRAARAPAQPPTVRPPPALTPSMPGRAAPLTPTRSHLPTPRRAASRTDARRARTAAIPQR